jgi:hypothetical protein
MKRAVVGVGLLAVVFAMQPRPTVTADEPSGPTVRVGSWNIEWLGMADKRREGAQDPADLAKYIAHSGVEVLALNEICMTGKDGDQPQNAPLAATLAKLKEQTGQVWHYRLFPKEDANDAFQLTGVAWNTAKVEMLGRAQRIPVRRANGKAGADLWKRHPYAIKFSTGANKTDIVLIPVHMKSNVGGEEATSKQRGEEATTLSRALAYVQNHFSDDDVLILGDMNCKLHKDPAPQRYVGVGFRDLNSTDLTTWIQNPRFPAAAFDRIFVPDEQPEFKGCVQKVVKETPFGAEDEYRRRCSDHYMVTTNVAIMDDDD